MIDEELIDLYEQYDGAGLGNIAAAILAGASRRTDEQTITLSAGTHEIAIPTERPPDKVYLSVSEAGVGTCVGNVNMVAAVIQDQGFVLYADIKSNSAQVSYIVHC